MYVHTYIVYCVPSFMQPFKSQKKVQSLLNQLYEDLDTQFDIGKDEVRRPYIVKGALMCACSVEWTCWCVGVVYVCHARPPLSALTHVFLVVSGYFQLHKYICKQVPLTYICAHFRDISPIFNRTNVRMNVQYVCMYSTIVSAYTIHT